MEKVITEITSYCGDTYQKVELRHSTIYHRIKKKGDIAFLPASNNLSLATTEIDLLRAERDRYKTALERLVVTAPREHYIGDHGMGRWETCETCENIIDLAKETLAEAVRP